MLLSGHARLAAVLGDPIGHSLSPRLHGYWFERHRIDGTCVPLHVRQAELEPCFRILGRIGFRGWNVTLPHKEHAFALVDRHDEAARRIGAVNTVLVQKDGSLLGRNTDGFGFLAHLRASLPDHDPACGPALVLGAGGAARAVAAALLEAGCPHLRITNRTESRARDLAAWLGHHFAATIEVVPWRDRAAALESVRLCVQTTRLGMRGEPPLELDLALLPEDAAVADIVYVPLETDLLRRARAAGHPVVDGLGMLIWQAVPGFRHWGGCEPAVDERVRACLLEALS